MFLMLRAWRDNRARRVPPSLDAKGVGRITDADAVRKR